MVERTCHLWRTSMISAWRATTWEKW